MVEDWTAIRSENGHWLFTWDGGSAESFNIWLNGKLLDTVEGGEYDCTEPNYADTPPPIEIVIDDSDTVADNDIFPPYAIIQWREVTGASSYLIEQYVSGSWVYRKTIQDSRAGYHWYKTALLTDQENYQYRVSALDIKGNPGTAVSFSFSITRNPAPPDVEYEIDGTGDLVVSEA